MNLEKYEILVGPDDFYYEFYSNGPKGRIKKMVRFTPLPEYGKDYYNLFLGDWLELERRASDTSISNNNDREKILATVAAIVIHFTFQTPRVIIFVEGSTPSRTRLYQMGIAQLIGRKLMKILIYKVLDKTNGKGFIGTGIMTRSCYDENKIVNLV